MNFKGMTIAEIEEYVERTGDRDAYPRYLKGLATKRDAEAKPLLDDLRKFNLDFESIDQIVFAPENALILAISLLVDYIDIFEDDNLHLSLALALSHPCNSRERRH